MLKRLTGLLIAMCLLVGLLPAVAIRADAFYSGSCGTDVIWELDTVNGVLKILGSGAMVDYVYETDTPWYSRNFLVRSVVIDDGVTLIGDYAFYDCSGLSHVHFLGDMPTMGTDVFKNCAEDLKLCYIEGTEGWDNCTYATEVWDYTRTVDGQKITYTCNTCGGVYIVEGPGPVVDGNISIGETLSLESDPTMNLRIKTEQLTAYDLSTAYLVVERDVCNSDGTVEVETSTLTEYTIKDDRLVFAYTGISAAQMNDEIRVVLHIQDADGNALESFDLSSGTVDSKGRFVVNFYGSTSRDMRRVVQATVYVGDNAISDTYTYTISSYAHLIANTAGMPETLVNLTRLMVIYGDSATAFFSATS